MVLDDYIHDFFMEFYLKDTSNYCCRLNARRMLVKVHNAHILSIKVKKQPGRPKKMKRKDKDEEESDIKISSRYRREV